jgi:histidinol-phosphate aminotransferase
MALVPSYVASLEPYVTGLSIDEVRRRFNLERVIKLASNENPLGPSPLAVEALGSALTGIFRYPDGGLALRQKLAERFNVRLENVIAGSGSEGLMADIVRTFLCDEDEILSSDGTFPAMRLLAHGRGVAYRTVPLRDWRFDLAALARTITPRTKLIYLANPNNPTGTIFTAREFDEFYRSVPERVLIILDEAYFEYAQHHPDYPDSMRYRYDNVITLRTFSKAYGLASARIGYGFAHQDLIAMLLKVKLPFEPSGLASAAGLAALDDRGFLQQSLQNNRRGMQQLMSGLEELGLRPLESQANFILIRLASQERAQQLFEALLREGVIVRPVGSFGLPDCLRITIGKPEENEICLSALQRILKSEPVAA